MEPFDPAINYGPNDAGVSALTIVLATVGVFVAIWAFGAISSLIQAMIDSKKGD